LSVKLGHLIAANQTKLIEITTGLAPKMVDASVQVLPNLPLSKSSTAPYSVSVDAVPLKGDWVKLSCSKFTSLCDREIPTQ